MRLFFYDKKKDFSRNLIRWMNRVWILLLVTAWIPLNLLPTDCVGDYVIVTTNTIYSESNSRGIINTFIEHKEDQGFGVTVITEDQYGSTSGRRQEHIRSWLKSHYMNGNTQCIKYVLLIGDPYPNPLDTDADYDNRLDRMKISDLEYHGKFFRKNLSVPMKLLTITKDPHDVIPCPSDLYYADLSGDDWDINDNGLYGEYYADYASVNGNGVDFEAEVYVGRIPVFPSSNDTDDYNKDVLFDILTKMIAYENASAPDQLEYRKSALLAITLCYAKDDPHYNEDQSLTWGEQGLKPVFQATQLIAAWPNLGLNVRRDSNNKLDMIKPSNDMPNALAVGNVDGIGKEEIIGSFAAGVSVYYREPEPTWQDLGTVQADLLAAGDLDNDGRVEILAYFSTENQVKIWNPGTNNWDVFISESPNLLSMDCGDFNGDGKSDWAGSWNNPSGPYKHGVWVRYSTSPEVWEMLCASPAQKVAAGDINGDGFSDLIGSWEDIGIYVRYTHDSNWACIHENDNDLLSMVSRDFDDDGKSDFIGSWNGFGVWIRYSSNGLWSQLHNQDANVISAGIMVSSATTMYQHDDPNILCYTPEVPDYNLVSGAKSLSSRLTNSAYGMVMWLAHGYPHDTNLGCGGSLFSANEADLLSDVSPAFFYENSCNNGDPKYIDNMQYRLLKTRAIGAIAWTGGGKSYDDLKNMGIAYHAYMNVYNLPVGEAFYRSKTLANNIDHVMNLYASNLYGDPSMRLLPQKESLLSFPETKADFRPLVTQASVSATLSDITVKFINKSQAADQFAWTFGETGTSTEENPEISFTLAGHYDVSLTATNSLKGTTDTQLVKDAVYLENRDNFIGSFGLDPAVSGKGIYLRDYSVNDITWAKLKQGDYSILPSLQLICGNFYGDETEDLAGRWNNPDGLWVRRGSNQSWELISSELPTWIAVIEESVSGKDRIVANFPGSANFAKGVWMIEYQSASNSWQKNRIIEDIEAQYLACGDTNGDGTQDIIGVWKENPALWIRNGYDEVITGIDLPLDFSANHIIALAVGNFNASVANDQDDIMVIVEGSSSTDDDGIWWWCAENSAWKQIFSRNNVGSNNEQKAKMLAVGNLDDDGIDDFIIVWDDKVNGIETTGIINEWSSYAYPNLFQGNIPENLQLFMSYESVGKRIVYDPAATGLVNSIAIGKINNW